MKKILNKVEVEENRAEIVEAIRSGKIFIYPTDTIYGLGCNALITYSVRKIREIKKRDTKPFLVVAPSKEWIEENCLVSREDIDKYLPGPYSLLIKKEKDAVANEVNPNTDILGIRIPDHWFSKIIQEAGVPFVTTSVNFSGESHMTSLEDLNPEILEQVDFVIYEGEMHGEPSTKIDLIQNES